LKGEDGLVKNANSVGHQLCGAVVQSTQLGSYDQFSRNMFRGTARSFASDARARAATRAALDRGDDATLSEDERAFLYMPLMHSEDVADQDRCVALFADAAPSQLRFAEQHRAIVRRFGRFPHRNAILERESTAEEREFLSGPGSSF
jgi:uncharacterized protein (DUF924 family)